MPHLPVSSTASSLPVAGAVASQATNSAAGIGTEVGVGVEAGQGQSFGALFSKQLKEISALLEGREISDLSDTLASKGEVAEAVVADGVAPPVYQFDLSALSALVSHQASALQQSSEPQQNSAHSQALVSLSGTPVPLAQSSKPTGELREALAFGGEVEKQLDGPSGDGDAQFAAEIAGNGKNLPQVLPSDESLVRKNAALVEADDSGLKAALPDVNSAARQPMAGMVEAVMPRQVDRMPALSVAPRVGSAEWGGAIGEKVLWMANQNSQVAELHLNPPNLGPLEVRLTVANDQATAQFVSHHAAVRDAIETALPRLREMLADNGIMLGNTSVGAESFSQQQHASDQRGRDRSGGDGMRGMEGVGNSVAGGAALARDGMVDIFA